MKKLSVLYCFLLLSALALTSGLVSCKGSYSPGDPVTDAEELALALAAAEDGATIKLAPNAVITLTDVVQVPKSVTITGEESAPAKMTLGKGGFEVSGSFKLANMDIDATASKEPFISLSEEPVAEELNGTDYYGIDDITLENLALRGVKSNLLYDNGVKYCVVSLNIENCLIELMTQRVDFESVISFKAGGAKDFTVRNSTIFGNSPEVQYFIRYDNAARLDRYGFDKTMEFQTMTYENNTFFDVIKNDGQWANYGGIGGQDFSRFIVKGNIWVDCGPDIIRRMAGGRFGPNAQLDFADNTYWRNGEALDESKYDTSGTALTTDPAFKKAPKDLTPTGAEQVEKKTGDPRWYN